MAITWITAKRLQCILNPSFIDVKYSRAGQKPLHSQIVHVQNLLPRGLVNYTDFTNQTFQPMELSTAASPAPITGMDQLPRSFSICQEPITPVLRAGLMVLRRIIVRGQCFTAFKL